MKIKIRSVLAIGILTAALLPYAAQAQGLVGGAREGAAHGDRVAGPVGAVVGGAVGAGVGAVNGALGIPAHYHPHCPHGWFWRHGHRYCR